MNMFRNIYILPICSGSCYKITRFDFFSNIALSWCHTGFAETNLPICYLLPLS